ncbi:hypothetical protein [Brumimicrobium mesophilum]|uniref:hypothetical protein n=1 Tax=Brumimicrobium mesophilum TaxID=392717 RepID=UPI000D141D65|nr:hypothetical protein [Brumimicrobium mesophilum]
MENFNEYNQNSDFKNNEGLSVTAKENLENSSIYVRIVAIIAIVGGALGALGGVFLLVANPIIGLIYLALYVVVIYVSTLLLNIGKSIDRGTFDMDKFATNFLKYWKIVAIVTIFGIAFTIISIVLGTAGALMPLG